MLLSSAVQREPRSLQTSGIYRRRNAEVRCFNQTATLRFCPSTDPLQFSMSATAWFNHICRGSVKALITPDWVIKQDSSSAVIFKSKILVRSQVCFWCNSQSKPQSVIQKGKAVKGSVQSGWDGFAWTALLHKEVFVADWETTLLLILNLFLSLAVLTPGNQDKLPFAQEFQASSKSKYTSPFTS